MKIAFVINDLGAGGAERAVTGLSNHWAEQYDITIITFVKTVPFYSLHPRVRLRYCLENPQKKANPFVSAKNITYRLIRLYQILKSERPTVVLSFMMKANIYTLWAAKWANIPCIISERANHQFNKLPRLQERLRDFSYKNVIKLVVQTEGNKQYYESIIPKHKITIIPNGVSELLQNERNSVLVAKEPIILNVGAFRKGKAQDELIKAFAKVSKNDSWRLVFAGAGPNLEYCKDLTNQLNLSKKVEFLGAQKNISYHYKKAEIFVFTSRHEGFPNALLEALYYGLPSISTNCPHGPSDLIDQGVNGFLVPVDDQDALCEKLEILMKDKELRASFESEAKARSERYEVAQIANQWIETIKSITD